MALRFQRKRKVNAMRIGIKVGMTVLALYIGGFFLNQIGGVMNGTQSAFYRGLTLIGWTVADVANSTTATPCAANTCTTASCPTATNCITNTSGAGILAIVGIIAIASLIFEFVDIRMT